MSQHKENFVALLEELFQLNQPELDFGLYRILHARSAQIKTFVQTELKQEIDKVFASQSQAGAHDILQTARKKVTDDLADDAFDANGELKPEYRNTKIGKEYEQARKQAQEGGGPLADDAQVYDHLYRFFSRYYDKGDFMSKRYFVSENDSRAAPYAIPYDGREVMLHWANKDQYYIKSSEYLANYTVDVAAAQLLAQQGAQGGLDFAAPAKPLKVHFRLAAASEGEHNNVKEGQERYFLIHAAEPIKLESNTQGPNELVIQFQYRPDPEKTGQGGTWQQKRLAEAEAMIRDHLANLSEAEPFADALFTLAPTDKQSNRSLLAKYLGQYTSRNTMDYFIHKNLGGFLRRELDFYIKNEVMRLDDIEAADAPRVESYLKKLQSLRKIARRIIDFLAQIEDFQKKLWLKKKFVVETNYCITLDRISESLYQEICEQAEVKVERPSGFLSQREEWVKLFAIDEMQSNETSSAYSIPLTVAFLKANDKLLLDTSFFTDALKGRLLGSIGNLEELQTGIIAHSDNFQALQALKARYQAQVKCIYIDPPYNTASSSIPYKNDFRHSSWATMMNDRVSSLHPLLPKNGAIFVSIDKAERTALEHVMDGIFGTDNKIEELIWSMNTNNSQAPNYSTNHEYVLVYAKDRLVAEQDRNMFREPKPGYEEVMALVAQLNPDYPSISTIEGEIKKLYEQHKIAYREEIESQGLELEDEKGNDPWKGLFNYSHAEYRDNDGRWIHENEAKVKKASIWVWQEADASMPATKQAASTRDPKHKNWRFYNPTHPVTGKPSPHPKSGWKFAFDDDEDSPDKRSFVALDQDSRIAWGESEKKVPRIKRMLHEVETNVGKSVFTDYSDGEKQTSALFGRSGVFLAPKHADFVSRFIQHAAKPDSVILDCFGGSGSTAHAVIKLNRDDHGARRFVTVEMGEYFDTITKPRILKAAYSRDWRAGKPVGRDGMSQVIKLVRLESYEDTLNNLLLPKDAAVDTKNPANSDLARDYLLKYWLDFETAGSPSLLNVRQFADPTNYTLMIKQPGSDAQVAKKVDLVETFNWLIGLHVALLDQPRRYQIELVHETDPDLPKDQDTRWVSKSIKEREDGEFWFRWVEGHVLAIPGDDSSRQRILVLWRKLTGDAGRDQAALEAYLATKKLNPLESEFDFIYINGSHALPSDGSASTRVRLIEETFAQRMWEDA